MKSASLVAIALSIPASHAFQASRAGQSAARTQREVRSNNSPSSLSLFPTENDTKKSTSYDAFSQKIHSSITAAAAAAALFAATTIPANAVSGGGLDYAGLDISNQDYSNGNYKGKDFTQVLAKATTFANSNLQGCRFYKAYLVNTNFEGADVRGVSFEDTSMDNANLKNIIASGAYFGQSLLDVKTLEGGDFTDAQVPTKTLLQVCDREDVKGTNPVTGVDTRDSLMCL
ncbi:hypothetical protein ACHAWT_001963 [Skeletonema menzelii]